VVGNRAEWAVLDAVHHPAPQVVGMHSHLT
jgi:hypothetical protein